MNRVLFFVTVFSSGYVVHDILQENKTHIIAQAHAEVAGMDSFDLRYDYDFKRAVRSITEDCSVDGYVDDEYLYDGTISC